MKSVEKRKVAKVQPVKVDPLGTYRKVLTRFLEAVPGSYFWQPKAVTLVRHSDWKSLYELTAQLETVVHENVAEHLATAQFVALVKKYPFSWKEIGLPISPKEQAIRTFLQSEISCKKYNRMFSKVLQGRYRSVLFAMRNWIHQVLGDKPNMREIYNACDFGPGSNVGVTGNATNLFRKIFSESWTSTRLAVPHGIAAAMHHHQLLLSFMEERNGLFCFDAEEAVSQLRRKIRVVVSNKVSFVPKTAKTDRSIAVEPLVNSFVQKGIDVVMRRKLMHYGYDLTDQGLNRELARIGSSDGSYATMDLTSASDSIGISLVKFLLPADWFDLLDRTRSQCYSYEGEEIRSNKFCTMGNGFCFPLETLIFASAARVVTENNPSSWGMRHAVYGDDIVIPTPCFRTLQRLLRVLGFKTNKRKSFWKGNFRESCGADWYKGQDVRPVYLDYHLDSVMSLMVFHNMTQRSPMVSLLFEGVRPMLRSMVPHHQRFVRPKQFSPMIVSKSDDFRVVANLNGAFDVPQDDFMSSCFARWHRDEQRWSWNEYLYHSIQDRSVHPKYHRAMYLNFLRGSPGGKLSLRRKTKRNTIQR